MLKQIRRLERSADPTQLARIARLFNQLGTLAESEGDATAVTYFGRAIDAYLEAGYFDAAAAMCGRLLRLHPEVVRARCTLAFLSIGRRQADDAIREIAEYTLASRRTGTERFAIPRLRLMAEATSDARIRRRIALALGELGDPEGREQVSAGIHLSRGEDAPDDGKRWERLLAAALLNREQLRRPEASAPAPSRGSALDAASLWEAA